MLKNTRYAGTNLVVGNKLTIDDSTGQRWCSAGIAKVLPPKEPEPIKEGGGTSSGNLPSIRDEGTISRVSGDGSGRPPTKQRKATSKSK